MIALYLWTWHLLSHNISREFLPNADKDTSCPWQNTSCPIIPYFNPEMHLTPVPTLPGHWGNGPALVEILAAGVGGYYYYHNVHTLAQEPAVGDETMSTYTVSTGTWPSPPADRER